MHECPSCGLTHEEAVSEAAPVVVEAEPGTSDNDVEIAKIEADARVKSEKIWAQQRDEELVSRVAELEGQLTGMREALDRIAPPEPPAPEPLVIPAPEPIAGPEEMAPPPAEKESEPKPAKKKTGFF